jgi:hypothetical protein
MAFPAESFPARGGKVRLDRSVIVIGVFLFAVGLAVAWNGYGYVQLERGWTQVISGTFAAGTGLVLVALGLILRELRTIAASAARATLLLAKGRNGLPAETPYAPPPSSTHAAPPPHAPSPAHAPPPSYAPPLEEFEESAAKSVAEAPGPVESSDPRQDSPLAWMVRANRPETHLDPRMPQAAASDAWLREPLAGRAEEWVEQPLAAEPQPSWKPLAAELEPAQEPEHEQALLPPREPELSPESFPEPVLEDFHAPAAEIVHAPAAEIVPEPEPEIAPAPELEPRPVLEHAPHPVPDPATEIPPEPVAETVHEEAPEPAADEPAPEPLPKPEIIGHYDAQGAHYTLYADGSIEAETPHGVYRFASMAELKRFIEGQAEGV